MEPIGRERLNPTILYLVETLLGIGKAIEGTYLVRINRCM